MNCCCSNQHTTNHSLPFQDCEDGSCNTCPGATEIDGVGIVCPEEATSNGFKCTDEASCSDKGSCNSEKQCECNLGFNGIDCSLRGKGALKK